LKCAPDRDRPWGLTAWYPGAKKGKRTDPEPESSTNKRAKKGKKTKKGNGELVIQFLEKHPNESFMPEAIAEAVGTTKIGSLRTLLSQMVKTDRISKGIPSGYRALDILT
jgi:hypothetical protein